MENYEQMFKEITKKLYGDGEIATIMVDYEVISSTVAPSDTSEETIQPETDCWISSEESIPWTKSKIASYNMKQKMFRCEDCECVGFLTRIAEHWLGTHANLRVFQCSQCPYTSAWARCVRMHLARQHNITTEQSLNADETPWKENPILEEVSKFLQRLKTKVETEIFPSVETKVKTEELSPHVSTELSGELPAQISTTIPAGETIIIKAPIINTVIATSNTTKRYKCSNCSYATDRRDLFTRHENIHRDEKPFHCYVCLKQFNRADHVKKHFVRIHRDLTYNINKIKRELKEDINTLFVHVPSRPVEATISKTDINLISFQPQPLKNDKTPKPKQEDKRYTCCYCTWSGMGNWCLKRHLNTHLKPFVCSLCKYKAARSERLATHVFKVHNKKLCEKCSFLTDDEAQLSAHVQQEHL